MPPQRSVVLDAEPGEHASGEPVGVMLAGHGKLNDLLPTNSVIWSSAAVESWSLAHTVSKAQCMA
jgi:hypothetical protein